MRTAKHLSKLAATVIVALTAVGMTALAQPKPGGSVVMTLNQEPDALDPQKSATAVVNLVMRYIGDTLVTKDLKGAYTAGLATRWTASRDGLSWTFNLKSGVKFHDGAAVNAAAVKASFERALDPETKSNVAASLLEPVKAVVAVNPTTVRIDLKRPYSILIENLTQPALSIVNATAARTAGSNFGRAPVLTGPWKVSQWHAGSQIVLKRNPDYTWGPSYAHAGPPHIETLTFQIIPDAATALAAFTANNTQVLTVPARDVQGLQSAGKYQMLSFLRKGLGLFMAFNTTKEPFNDESVRKALQPLVNKQALVAVALRGLGEPACGPLPASIWGYWEGICRHAAPYDVARGRRLLEQAGWRPGAGGVLAKNGRPLRFTLYSTATPEWLQSAQIIQAQLKAVGVQVDIETFELNTLLSKARAGDHQALLMAYTYTSADILNSYFNSANIGTGYNWSHYKDERIDTLLAQSRSVSNSNLRLTIYKDLQKYVVDKALWLPLWTNQNFFAVQPQVKDVKLSAEGFLVLLDAYVE